jgi:hypothetical protein
MSSRTSLSVSVLGSALLIAGVAARAGADPAPFDALHGSASPDIRGRTCATAEPTLEERARLQALTPRALAPVGGTIQVALHVIHDAGEGNLTDAEIQDQIRELNRNFLGTGYRFSLASVDRTDSKRWFRLIPGSGDERHMKDALAIDPAHRMNVYTLAPKSYLGWAYLPWSLPEEHALHGVVIHYGTLPGGPIEFFNLGRTLTHEVGHYLGLFHTFQGGCDEPGDFVADTPAEATPNTECPEFRDTCPSPGEDPIHNYMDYSFDECYTEFTDGQDDRMDAIVPVYRPSLLDAALAFEARPEPAPSEPAVPRVLSFRGAWPNPFRDETVLRYSLPASGHVQLRVYDLAGHLVADVVNAMMPAGDHSAPFRGRGLPAGLYFAWLRVDGATFTRNLVHVP